ncbi:MAG TPA: hypothetical protein VN969_25035 [Streptosporangiaceae bacterium]|nr:hypothetical protein [Streptosporangiaceae bacterium]
MTDHAAAGPALPGPAYTDQAAINDIHVLLTSPLGQDGALESIAEIIARTGRPLTAGRDIEVITGESPLGWPVVQAVSAGTTVTIRQDPTGPGLRVEITTRLGSTDTPAVSLDSRPLVPAW